LTGKLHARLAAYLHADATRRHLWAWLTAKGHPRLTQLWPLLLLLSLAAQGHSRLALQRPLLLLLLLLVALQLSACSQHSG
jgi:hypothetical protein